MYHIVEHIACFFNCYYIRCILNTQMDPSAQMTGIHSVVKLKFVNSVFVVQWVLSVHELDCSGYRPFVISHINTSITASGNLFRRIRKRKAWLSSQLSHMPFWHMSCIKSGRYLTLYGLWNGTVLQSFIVFYPPKKVCILLKINFVLFEVMLYLCYWYICEQNRCFRLPVHFDFCDSVSRAS
jgi:hypothetical protein